ncbi:2906_t:CDS:1, partial [Racocetra fulgida]
VCQFAGKKWSEIVGNDKKLNLIIILCTYFLSSYILARTARKDLQKEAQNY